MSPNRPPRSNRSRGEPGPTIGESRSIRTSAWLHSSDLPEIRGDESALRRALENLLTNATKFAADGGWVRIRAERREDGRMIVVRVEDRGPGIAKTDRGRVFEPFFRGRNAHERQAPGSGLGLSLVRHVAEAHGGHVHLESRDEGGTAAVMELPIPAESEEKQA